MSEYKFEVTITAKVIVTRDCNYAYTYANQEKKSAALDVFEVAFEDPIQFLNKSYYDNPEFEVAIKSLGVA